jgi:anthranilate synthase component II
VKILLLDNFDSFTYNLADYFRRLKVECTVIRNDESLETLQNIDFDALVLSPGPGTPAQGGIMNDAIAYYAEKKPILGVCLGHQALGQYFGANLCKASVPKHGKISEIICKNENLFKNLPERYNVVRYHSLILTDIVAKLKVTAQTNDNLAEIMAFEHQTLPIFGVQFHPEAILTEYGLELLENFIHISENYLKK